MYEIYRLPLQEMYKIAPLFDGWEEALIWSGLQGVMGNAYTIDVTNPKSAAIVVGDFCFLAGEPQAALLHALGKAFTSEYMLVIPNTKNWCETIEKNWGEDASETQRYAIKKEPNIFDKEKLKYYEKAISSEYRLFMIDESLYHKVRETDWARDLCAVFADYREYREKGIGVVAMRQDQIVSGASSYAAYKTGIEIEIDTKKECRRQGLALACGAKLILACLDKGLYPSWDAHDLRSVELAEKLGYHRGEEYLTYLVKV